MALRQLAHLYGIQFGYNDVFKHHRRINNDILPLILKAMNVAIDNPEDAQDLLRTEILHQWAKPLPPVILAWDGGLADLILQSTDAVINKNIPISLILEDGSKKKIQFNGQRQIFSEKVEGVQYYRHQLQINQHVPYGYHQLAIELNGQLFTSFLISAPYLAYVKKYSKTDRKWGLFAPLYAMHSEKTFGAGNFTDLTQIIEWLAQQGGEFFGSLPLFANFLKKPCEPSPYSPITKLFFNEFYLDITQIPEFNDQPEARQLYHSANKFSKLIDYKKIMLQKRKIIELLANQFFSQPSENSRYNAFQKFLIHNQEINCFAIFCALQDKLGKPWRLWPKKLKYANVTEQDYDHEIKNYYLFSQWQTQIQLTNAANRSKQLGVELYLDMPLGVHADGYDTWRLPELFAHDLSVGAAPDAGFTTGQNWCFPPLIPHKLRENHYQYFIQSLKQVLPLVGLLRLDHVMGLHRLYCIPSGQEAKNGVFIRYRPDELYAILCLESQRHQTCIIGENLGTVPKYVTQALEHHHFYRMNVIQYELKAHQKIIPPGSNDTVSSLNTHDMPPFAAFIQGLDIPKGPGANKEWQRRKLLNPTKGKLSRTEQKKILLKSLYQLAKDRSQFLLINLEDLWLETHPQNIPASKKYPNWRRRTKMAFERWREDPLVCATIKNIGQLRRKG